MAILNEADRSGLGTQSPWGTQSLAPTGFGACSLCLDKILCDKNVPARAGKINRLERLLK
jgi:hypothetical protein